MKNNEVYELTKDERALIYQHVQELQNEVPGFGPVNVLVHKNENDEFELTFETEDGLNFQTFGKGFSIYEASLMAKEALRSQLRIVLGMTPNSPDRALQIFSILHGSTLH